MAGLRVAPRLTLPPEIVVEKNAILAMSGAGKSNAAVVLAEAMHTAGYPWVAIDPKGDWWGIRSGPDGKGVGLPIPVLGGAHGDVPLEPTAGRVIANLVADQRLTCVLDVSEFDSRNDMFRFLWEFAEQLLRRNTLPLHVFAEEADDYLPQRTSEKGYLPRCLGAWQRLVKRGRQRGIGSTLITQRSSAINKDVLNMTDTLIVMRTTAPLDRKAVAGWVETHAGKVDLLDSLPELADGEAWIWSPQKLKLTERVTFYRRVTFDSGATPLMGAKARIATLADVDLDALKDSMAETIERARADDPEVLRARIRDLERENKALESRAPTETVRTETIEVVPEWIEEMLADLTKTLGGVLGGVQRASATVSTSWDRFSEARKIRNRRGGSVPAGAKENGTQKPMAPPPTPLAGAVIADPVAALELSVIGKGPLTILGVLHQHGGAMDKQRLRFLAGQARSTFDRYLSTLRAGDLVQDGNPITITPAGMAAAPKHEVMPPPGDGLFNWWANHPKVGVGPRSILVALREAGGQAPKAEIREQVDQARSTFDRYCATLRSLGIVRGTDPMVLLEDLR